MANFFENENIESLQLYIKNQLSDFDILNMRFSSTKKTLLIKLILLETNQFVSIFNLIKEKLKKNDLKSYVNLPDNDSNTPLLYASFNGNIEKVECLINNGAKIEMRNFMGLSVMHMAAQGNKPNILIYFKDKYGFNINDRDFPGNTPLHWACHMPAENAINFLLSWIDDVNLLNRKGQTPLHLGIYCLKAKIIKKLLRKGADINSKDFSGRSIMDILNDKKSKVPNFKDVLRVINNNETFHLCIYPKKIEQDNNEFKDNNLKERLIEENENNEASKSYLTYKKIFNSIMFVSLHIFFETIIYFFLLTKLDVYLYYILFWILILTLFILFLLVRKTEPGFLEVKDNLTWLQMVENKIRIEEYCPYCRVRKTNIVKHCHICKKCVKGFDHHCDWIDNCVGENNKLLFLSFVIMTLLNLTFNIFIGFISLRINPINNLNENSDSLVSLEFLLNMKWLFNYSLNYLIAIFIIIICIFFFLPVFYMFILQVRNIIIGNNYEY